MQRAVLLLALVFGCLISGDVRSAAAPPVLALEQTTILRVGELAVLQIPSDSRYSHSGTDGAWRSVLALVRQSRQTLTFRAVVAGSGVIIISPDVPNGECLSCATLRYFIKVVSNPEGAIRTKSR